MLWVLVCAGYLTILRPMSSDVNPKIALTILLAVLLITRFCWGSRGNLIAVPGLALVPTGLWLWESWYEVSGEPVLGTVFLVLVWVYASALGLFLCLFVNAVVYLVDWLDSLGRKPSPPDS